MSKSRYRPRCYCTATLLPNGACPHGCDPALRRPSARAARLRSTLRERDQRSGMTIGLSTELVTDAARKCLPDYGKFGAWAVRQANKQRRLAEGAKR